MAPVALGIDVAEIQGVLFAQGDVCHRPADLPGDERPAAAGTLVVEEDAVARIHAVRLAVVDGDPVRVQLGDAVGTARIKGRRLALGRLDDLAVQLGRRRLVEADVLLEPDGADGVEETQRAEAVDVGGVLGHLERDLDVRLGAQVVDLRGEHLGEDVDEIGAVREIAVVQLELVRACGGAMR